MAGQIGWVDLTVSNAQELRDFYEDVTGWTPSSVSMGDYEDYCMAPTGGETPVAGICHARGSNAAIPPVWMIYITVDDLDAALQRCTAHGGKVRVGPVGMGARGRFAIIEDPAGAIAGLWQSA
jgi:predicted enzyme related to lactoylglutathione lyase